MMALALLAVSALVTSFLLVLPVVAALDALMTPESLWRLIDRNKGFVLAAIVLVPVVGPYAYVFGIRRELAAAEAHVVTQDARLADESAASARPRCS